MLVREGRIAAVLASGDVLPSVEAAERIDLEGQVLMPGLVNAHYHSYGNVVRGTENCLPLEQWALFAVA
ncbi:MAG: hypothetical protein L6R19_16720 [Alphaproteobacteria bacterium]|nr:hypothetical protein [Alphaproteobacteria bacterium]